MVHVLEAGLTFLEANNPNNRPSVKGFNIINGQLAESSDGATFESRNPAILRDVLGAFPLSTKDDVNAALDACLLYTSPSPRDLSTSRMPSSA